MYKAVCKNFWLSWCDLDDGFLTAYTICVIVASVMQLGVVWPLLIRSDASRSLAVMGFAGWCKPSSRSVAACRAEIYSIMVPTTWPFWWKTIATCKLVLALCWWWAALNEECLINSYTLKATWFDFFCSAATGQRASSNASWGLEHQSWVWWEMEQHYFNCTSLWGKSASLVRIISVLAELGMWVVVWFNPSAHGCELDYHVRI